MMKTMTAVMVECINQLITQHNDWINLFSNNSYMVNLTKYLCRETLWNLLMSNPNALIEDIQKLDALYEELCWDPDDELVFIHENGRVVIYNKTQEQS